MERGLSPLVSTAPNAGKTRHGASLFEMRRVIALQKRWTGAVPALQELLDHRAAQVRRGIHLRAEHAHRRTVPLNLLKPPKSRAPWAYSLQFQASE